MEAAGRVLSPRRPILPVLFFSVGGRTKLWWYAPENILELCDVGGTRPPAFLLMEPFALQAATWHLSSCSRLATLLMAIGLHGDICRRLSVCPHNILGQP